VLVAEVVAGELARRLGLPVPELVLVEVDPVLGMAEPDEEVQDLLRASAGTNLGMDFLPRRIGFDPLVHEVDSGLASRVLWFDALVGNVDRSWRNPNLLLWHRGLQLIDHGATLVFHHDWSRAERAVERAYDVGDHVLADVARSRAEADAELAPQVTAELLSEVVRLAPTCGSRTSPGSRRPTTSARRTSCSSPAAWPPASGGPREPLGLRVRRPAGRPAARARRVRQRRRRPLLPDP
jgi:hypothetical protein